MMNSGHEIAKWVQFGVGLVMFVCGGYGALFLPYGKAYMAWIAETGTNLGAPQDSTGWLRLICTCLAFAGGYLMQKSGSQ